MYTEMSLDGTVITVTENLGCWMDVSYVGNVESWTVFEWRNIKTVLWRMFDQTVRLHSDWNYMQLEGKLQISRFFCLFVCLFVCLFLFFWDRVSLYSSGCPGTHSVDQAGLEHRNLPASASQVLGLKACTTTLGWDTSYTCPGSGVTNGWHILIIIFYNDQYHQATGADVLFWPPQAPGMHMVQRHTCSQTLIHVKIHKYINLRD